MIRYIGDIHGRDDLYAKALADCRASVQVGDFGFGFIPDQSLARWPGGFRHRMIRGNHDDPAKAEKHPGFIDSGYDQGVFYVNGGSSIDREWRLAYGHPWWPDEEHSHSELEVLIDIYALHKPRRVVSHEGPASAVAKLFKPKKFKPSRTSLALDAMLSIHRPAEWIFGHWHKRRDEVIDGTRFICLEEGGWVDLEDPT